MKRVLFSLAVLSVSFSLQAQTKMPSFAKLGYNKQLLYTSSKGEFDEFHDQADVVEIGSILFNTKTNQMVGFVSEEKTDAEVSSATTAMSIDPLCEKYYWISPYAFCLNNPVRYVDPNGKDVYGFDINTGKLSLVTTTDDDFDRIQTGTYNDNNEFTANDSENYLDISKGTLLGESFDNIAESGIVFHEGFIDEGIQTMTFLSFNSNIELSGWGFKSNAGEGVSIAPWADNTVTSSIDIESTSYKIATFGKDQVGRLGEKTFFTHTHPETKDGRGGYAIPSSADKNHAKGYPTNLHYIISKKQGIYLYDKNGSIKRTGIQ